MIYLDVREGVSGDMLLSALLGLLDENERSEAVRRIVTTAASHGLEFRFSEILDSGDRGYGISCVSKESGPHGRDRTEAFEILASMQRDLESKSLIPNEILMAIFEAEAEAHGESPETVHIHEIGRAEAILNMAGIGMLADMLRMEGHEEICCSSVTIGKGTVVISHGAIRIPAPASKILLRGFDFEEGTVPGERATPTGIAALKVLCREQNEAYPDKYLKRSFGYGTKRFAGRLGRVVAYS